MTELVLGKAKKKVTKIIPPEKKDTKGGLLPKPVPSQPKRKKRKNLVPHKAPSAIMYKHFATALIPASVTFPMVLLGEIQCFLSSRDDLSILGRVDHSEHRFIRLTAYHRSSDWRNAFQPNIWKRLGIKLDAVPDNVHVTTDKEIRLNNIELKEKFRKLDIGGIALKGGE